MFDIPDETEAMIFDCDGTLVDSMGIHWNAIHKTFASFDKNCPQHFLEERAGVPLADVIYQFNEKYNENIDVDEFFERKHEYSKDSLKNVKPILPVVNIAQNHHPEKPMAVVSGGSQENVNRSLKNIGLEDHFDPVLTADTPLPPKPAPHLYLEAAERMDVKPGKCLVFEDGKSGIKGAKKAGMGVININEYNI